MANPIGGLIKSLPMEQMFAGPIMAAVDAQAKSAMATAQFIEQIGLNKDGSVRSSRFSYKELSQDESDPTKITTIERSIDVPFAGGVVPIPNLVVQEINVDFEMRVDTSQEDTKETSGSATFSGSVGFAFYKAKFSGSVSHKSAQTRKTDTSAKYTVSLKAVQAEMPEGLSRAIDHMIEAQTKPIDKDSAPALPDNTKSDG